MTSTEARPVLCGVFNEKSDNVGWISYWASDALDLRGFGTTRIAKLWESKNLLSITIGETARGKQLKLDRAIDAILEIESFEQVPDPSTNTSRDAVYQGIRLDHCDTDRLRRTLYRLEGAIAGVIAANAATEAVD